MLLSRADVREPFIASSHPCSVISNTDFSVAAAAWPPCSSPVLPPWATSCSSPCARLSKHSDMSVPGQNRAFSSCMALHRAQQVCTVCQVPPGQVTHWMQRFSLGTKSSKESFTQNCGAALSRFALWNRYDVQQREWDFDTVNSLWQSCKPEFIFRFLSMSAGDTKWNFRCGMFCSLAATLQGKAALSLTPGYHGCFVWHSKRDCSCHAYFAGACDSLETGTSFVSTFYGSGDMSFILTLPKYGCSQSYPASYPVTNPLPVSAIVICLFFDLCNLATVAISLEMNAISAVPVRSSIL